MYRYKVGLFQLFYLLSVSNSFSETHMNNYFSQLNTIYAPTCSPFQLARSKNGKINNN